MPPRRDMQLDAARGLGMLLVLCGHLLEPLFMDRSAAITPGPAFAVWRLIYAFHMPFFFLVCGVTDGIKEPAGCRAAAFSALKLVATALAFSTLALIPQVAFGDRSAGEAVLDTLRGSGLGLAPLWFLIVLALVRVIHAGASATASARRFWLVIAGALAVSWLFADRSLKFWHLYSLVGALPFYVAGRRLGPRAFKLPLLWAGWGLAALLIAAPDNLAHVASGRYGSLPLFTVAAIGGCCFMLGVAGRLEGRPLSAAARVGRMSFDLFIVSGAVLVTSPDLRPLDGWIGLAAICAVALPLQIAAARLLQRPIAAIRKAAEDVAGALAPRAVQGGRRLKEAVAVRSRRARRIAGRAGGGVLCGAEADMASPVHVLIPRCGAGRLEGDLRAARFPERSFEAPSAPSREDGDATGIGGARGGT